MKNQIQNRIKIEKPCLTGMMGVGKSVGKSLAKSFLLNLLIDKVIELKEDVLSTLYLKKKVKVILEN